MFGIAPKPWGDFKEQDYVASGKSAQADIRVDNTTHVNTEEAVGKFDELAYALNQVMNTPNFLEKNEGRYFQEECKNIYEGLAGIGQDKQQNTIEIVLSTNQIILTEHEGNVVVRMGDFVATLDNTTLTTLSEQLHNSLYVSSFVKEMFSKNSWKGRIYNQDHPLPRSGHTYKNEPYRSTNDDGSYPKELNCQATFVTTESGSRSTKAPIVCCDLAAWYIINCWKDEGSQGKASKLKKLTTEAAIRKHVQFETQAAPGLLRKNAKSYNLINNDQLGEHIHACFDDMQTKKETFRTWLVESPNHSMAIRLRIKGTEKEPVYVVSFYDPNSTNAAMRCESTDSSTFKHHTLEKYITGLDTQGTLNVRYNNYYSEGLPVSMVTECNLDSLKDTKGILKPAKLTSFASGSLTATHLYLLLTTNSDFSDYVVELKNILRKKSPEELMHVLAAKRADGTHGLCMALQNGHTEAILAYGKLLQLIPEKERSGLLDLLFARRADGLSGLYMALQNGHTEAILAYGKLLQLIPEGERGGLLNLLSARRQDGTPGLFMALQLGHLDTILAYKKLFQLLPKADREKLFEQIAAVDRVRAPGLHEELNNGNKRVIEIHEKLVQLLSSWKEA